MKLIHKALGACVAMACPSWAFTVDFEATETSNVESLTKSGIERAALSWGYLSARSGYRSDVFTVEVADLGQIVVADRLSFIQFLPYPNLGNLASLDNADQNGDFIKELDVMDQLVIVIPGEEPQVLIFGKGLSVSQTLRYAPRSDHYSSANAAAMLAGSEGEFTINFPQGDPSEQEASMIGMIVQGAKGAKGGLSEKGGLSPKAGIPEVKLKERLYWFPPNTPLFTGYYGEIPPDTPVPEPSSTLLLLVGAAGLLRRRRG